MITLLPENAWKQYILPFAHIATWMEESKPISNDMPLSKRELYGLIMLAHINNYLNGNDRSLVGYDENSPEPNDGFITDSDSRINVEHKIIPQISKQDPLEAILSTYEKYANKGGSYGNKRTLIIHPNVTTQGMIKISDLRDKISGESPFDRVLLMHAVTKGKDNIIPIHVTEHYPGFGIAQVDFNVLTGLATVPHYSIK